MASWRCRREWVLLLASLALRLKHAILNERCCYNMLLPAFQIFLLRDKADCLAESMAAVRSRAGLDTIPMGTEGQDGLVCITIIDV